MPLFNLIIIMYIIPIKILLHLKYRHFRKNKKDVIDEQVKIEKYVSGYVPSIIGNINGYGILKVNPCKLLIFSRRINKSFNIDTSKMKPFLIKSAYLK